jgi:hypothetical protein
MLRLPSTHKMFLAGFIMLYVDKSAFFNFLAYKGSKVPESTLFLIGWVIRVRINKSKVLSFT